MTATTNTPTPFKDDAEYLDANIAAIHARCRRIVSERELREAQQPHDRHGDVAEAQQKATTALQRQKAVGGALDARLAVHRAEDSFTLGIDKLTAEADLNDEARMILLCCFSAAISEDTAVEVFDGLDFAMYVSMTVEGLCRVLEANTVADRLRVRRYFESEAPLLKHGLVKLDGRLDRDVAEDLNGINIKLTAKAFNVLVGAEVQR